MRSGPFQRRSYGVGRPRWPGMVPLRVAVAASVGGRLTAFAPQFLGPLTRGQRSTYVCRHIRDNNPLSDCRSDQGIGLL